MRTFKRLFPVFLVSVLLAGVALAQPAIQTGTNHSPALKISKPQFGPGNNHTPDPPKFYFGTVVRDTADDQSAGAGQWQVPPQVSQWNSFFTWSWFSLLISR